MSQPDAAPSDPMPLGVCSWSLQVTSIPELTRLMDQLGTPYAQIACGDPVHASWDEGEAMPEAALGSGLVFTAAMLGFPGEDYTSPQTIRETGGFGPVALRQDRLERLAWALDRTRALGLNDLTLHAGFLPELADPERPAFLKTLERAATMASVLDVTLAFETGQETADLLRATLQDLDAPNLKVNFDPANMLLYNMGDPIRAIDVLAGFIQSVHAKDARRPQVSGQWGEEVPLGQGQVDIPRFIQALRSIGYRGPIVVEREVGDQHSRVRDIAQGLNVLRDCLAS